MAVKGTEYSVRDASGNVLCHPAGGSKRNADSRRKRAVREAFNAMCEAAGMVNHRGEYRDVMTGGYFPLADENTPNSALIVVDRGHVISDENDGAFCPCNLVPELRAHNKAHGRRNLDSAEFVQDPRAMWREVWARTAKASKVARAV